MTVVRFPAPGPRAPALAQRIARIEAVLEENRDRQSHLHEQGRRLDASLLRLRILTRRMALAQRSLGRSLARLRALQRTMGH